jgi:hypothetical protein
VYFAQEFVLYHADISLLFLSSSIPPDQFALFSFSGEKQVKPFPHPDDVWICDHAHAPAWVEPVLIYIYFFGNIIFILQ